MPALGGLLGGGSSISESASNSSLLTTSSLSLLTMGPAEWQTGEEQRGLSSTPCPLPYPVTPVTRTGRLGARCRVPRSQLPLAAGPRGTVRRAQRSSVSCSDGFLEGHLGLRHLGPGDRRGRQGRIPCGEGEKPENLASLQAKEPCKRRYLPAVLQAGFPRGRDGVGEIPERPPLSSASTSSSAANWLWKSSSMPYSSCS